MKREPRETGVITAIAPFLLAVTMATAPAAAQQVTGELGASSATTTIDGKQIPPPPPPFGGVIKQSAVDSKPWWPPRIVPQRARPMCSSS
jgi:hypothetical protein